MISIKYKLYKNKKLSRIDDLCITSSYIWNHCLALQNRYYSLYGGYIHKYKLQKHLTKLRRKNPYWQKLGSQAVQEIVVRLDDAFKRFFNHICDHTPKFKNVNRSTSFILRQKAGYSISNNVLTLNGIGTFKFNKHREFTEIKRITIKKDKVGDFWLIVICPELNYIHEVPKNRFSVGIDFGLKTFLTLSDGTIYSSPLLYKENISSIKKAHRQFSNKTKDSKNWHKARINLARVHKKVTNRRSDFHWKLANELCKKYSFIALEDLDIRDMVSHYGRKVSDLSYGRFIIILEHTAKKYNTVVQKINRFFPSSKLCKCGFKNDALTLETREWNCPSCGAINNRDVLAASNILSEGIRIYRSKHKTKVS